MTQKVIFTKHCLNILKWAIFFLQKTNLQKKVLLGRKKVKKIDKVV